MGKTRTSKSVLMRQWIDKLGAKNIYTIHGDVIYCQACQRPAPSGQYFLLKQHNDGDGHIKFVEKMKQRPGSILGWIVVCYPILPDDLAFIHAHFSNLPSAIERLEAQGVTLVQALEIVANVRNYLDEVPGAGLPGTTGEKIRQKINNVLERNPGFEAISRIAVILNGGHVGAANGLPSNVVANFKYAPIQSCDVERSFSVYKKVLADDRTRFTPENLEMYLICNCNQ